MCFNRFQAQEYNFENQRVTVRMAQIIIDYGGFNGVLVADVNWVVDKKKGDTFLLQLIRNTEFKSDLDLKNN